MLVDIVNTSSEVEEKYDNRKILQDRRIEGSEIIYNVNNIAIEEIDGRKWIKEFKLEEKDIIKRDE